MSRARIRTILTAVFTVAVVVAADLASATGGVTLRLANLGSTPSSLTNLGTITVNTTAGGTVVVDGLAAPDATAGCLITDTDASVASQIKAEYGY